MGWREYILHYLTLVSCAPFHGYIFPSIYLEGAETIFFISRFNYKENYLLRMNLHTEIRLDTFVCEQLIWDGGGIYYIVEHWFHVRRSMAIYFIPFI